MMPITHTIPVTNLGYSYSVYLNGVQLYMDSKNNVYINGVQVYKDHADIYIGLKIRVSSLTNLKQ